MPHIRTRIATAARTRLTGLATTGPRVFRHHHALAADEWPALRVTTMNERSVRIGGACPLLAREIELLVEAWAKGGDTLEDTLDTIAAEVEAAIATDETFGDLAIDATLDATTKTIDATATDRVGRLTLTFTVRATTTPGTPTEPA